MGALALVLVQIVPARCQTVAPGQGVSCPHATANTQGFFCYDTPSSQFQFDCANFNSQICNCDPSGSIFYTYTVQNCCFKCGCCIKGASPPPPAYPPTAPPPPTRPPPALPSNVEDWFTLVVGVYYIPSFNMKETHSIKVPDQTGYSQANLDRALKWCTTTGAAEMDAAYPENKPYRIYAVGYHGPDGPNCGCDIYTCLQGNNPHPCQTQSSVNRWECNYNRPMNDGVSPNNPDGAVYGTGFPSCEHDLTFNNVNLNMPGCFYEGQSQGYIWFRPPLISDSWLDAIDAGTQTNPLVMPNSPPALPSAPPHPPGAAPTPPPAVPDRWRDADVPVRLRATGRTRREPPRLAPPTSSLPRSCAWTTISALASPATRLASPSGKWCTRAGPIRLAARHRAAPTACPVSPNPTTALTPMGSTAAGSRRLPQRRLRRRRRLHRGSAPTCSRTTSAEPTIGSQGCATPRKRCAIAR